MARRVIIVQLPTKICDYARMTTASQMKADFGRFMIAKGIERR
jgi:hypothetical protein